VKLSLDQAKYALNNRDEVLADLDRFECGERLLDFVRLAWKQLEPSNHFVYGWAVEAVCDHLQAVSDGHIKKLVINVPPGCTKSMTTNVFWPAWEWGPRNRPDLRYISASYEKGLATRDLVRGRDLIRSEWYSELWPIEFKKDQDQKTYYENMQRGWRLAASVGGALTGYRGDRQIIDDPHDVKNAESDVKRTESIRWFTETLPTRLNKASESVQVVIMQRLHEHDVTGVILSDLIDDWVHLMIPMEFESKHRCFTTIPSSFGEPSKRTRVMEEGEPLPTYVEDEENGELMYPQDPRTEEGELMWPERFSQEAVDALKRTFRAQGGSYAEAAQLQQRPVSRSGGLIDKAKFNFIDTIPDDVVAWCRGWDLAASTTSTSPFTAGVLLGITARGSLVIADVERTRDESWEVEALIKNTAQRDGPGIPLSIPQDPGQAGKAQKNHYARFLHGFDFHFSVESGDKVVRARAFASQVQTGNVFIVRAAWNGPYLAEAGLFPASRYKDQIDATSRAYAHLIQNTGMSVATTASRVY
jgi:predicted phage terminase large subunit-like protein